ncbi:YncE family protein [Micromonospora auratinigra]|uniref:40-residue YVTN family beta-propeller repeat-containing protein n=1 Tax=Micromonospora auratinigra TaxID=261654 RepID=A0A1A9A668_9ACTN|nr:hypothetical protein [Micromonospora auratinigra]SBT51618.1 hypothetical protein GA0070611_5256 [Micromonospora auratinigra]
MRGNLVARLMVAVLGAAAGAVAPLAAGVAHAEGPVGLGLQNFTHLVVDPAHGQLFVSQGRYTSDLRVTDLNGGARRTIPNLPGATGMALSPDGATLYVALVQGSAVAAIDTATLTEKARYGLGASSCPEWLAPAGGKLYVGYGCSTGKGMLASIDVRGATPVVALDLPLAGGTYYDAPFLVSSPANPGRLVVLDRTGVNVRLPARATLYDVSSGTPSRVAAVPPEACSALQDAAVSADGSRVVLACSYVDDPASEYAQPGSAHLAYSLTDLTPAGTYPSATSPYAVATAPDGAHVVLGTTADSIHVARPDGTPVRRYDLPAGHNVERQGLAVGADSRTLYAVTTDQNHENPVLRRLTDYRTAGSTILLAAPATTPRTKLFTVDGSLSFAGAQVSSPRTLRVVKQDLTGSHPLADVTTDTAGKFSFSDVPLVGGPVTYTVSFAGNGTQPGASRSETVQVSRTATALSLTTKVATLSSGRGTTVTAQLGTTYRNRTVCLYAQPSGGARRQLSCGEVDGYGRLTASWPQHRGVSFTATFAGDERNAPAEVAARSYGTLLKPGVFRGN